MKRYPMRNDHSDDVVWREEEDEVLLMVGDKLQLLNSTAATIWQLCDGTREVDDIRAALLSEYGVSSAKCGADLDACLAELADLGALTFKEAPVGGSQSK